jgi:hypothetical protein
MSRDERWLEIEREAHAQAVAELETREGTPLVFGHHIAWVDCRFGRTDGLSAVHRVGFPNGHYAFTGCGEVIPDPVRWMVLCPALIRTLSSCRFCEAEMVRAARENAA